MESFIVYVKCLVLMGLVFLFGNKIKFFVSFYKLEKFFFFFYKLFMDYRFNFCCLLWLRKFDRMKRKRGNFFFLK